jgi:hypothetical protein
MLFVTGGQDPIVRPGNVLDAAPTGGVNLINIAGMSHFPTKPKERVQELQRDFWLKQLGHIVPAFAEQADNRRLEVLQRSWLNIEGTALHASSETAYEQYEQELDEAGEPASSAGLTPGGSLSDRWFGKEIERICDFIGDGEEGWVLVSRNEVPPVFQSEEVLKRYAAGLHHSEDLAADEFRLALRRREALTTSKERVTLMVTDIAIGSSFKESPSLFPPRSETPGVARLPQEALDDEKRHFDLNWIQPNQNAVRVLSAGDYHPHQLGEIGEAVRILQGLDPDDPATRINVRFLPDAWIGIGAGLLNEIRLAFPVEGDSGSRVASEHAIVAWGTSLAQERIGRSAGAAGSDDGAGSGERLEAALKEKTLSIIEFSRAGLNPRYRGKRVKAPKRAGEVLIHWALAYKAAGVEPSEKLPVV